MTSDYKCALCKKTFDGTEPGLEEAVDEVMKFQDKLDPFMLLCSTCRKTFKIGR